VKNFARIDAEELPELLKKIENYRGTLITRLAIKLMALTFLRTTPLITAEWSEIDFQGKRWKVRVSAAQVCRGAGAERWRVLYAYRGWLPHGGDHAPASRRRVL
jgi:integrase